MLSRIADSLFWLGRYIERAEYTARLLDVNFHMLLEQTQTELVNRHHGEVRVWSTRREGRSGTAFSVFLPFGDMTAAAELADEAVPAEG